MKQDMNIKKDNLESLIQAYVFGRLDEAQAEEFEAYFLAQPELVEMIDSAQKLHIGLDNMPATPVSMAIAEKPSIVDKLIGLIKVPVPAYGVAAAMVLTMMVGPASLTSINSTPNLSQPQLVRLDTTSVRSTGAELAANLSVGGKSAAMVVRVKEVEFPQYRLKVSSAEDNEALWDSGIFEFASGARDYLVVVPPEAAVDNVRVELFGISQGVEEVKVSFCNYTEACF